MLGLNLFLCLTMYCDAAKILAVFPTPCISHHKIFQRFTQKLAEQEHEIIMINTLPDVLREKRNFREINMFNDTSSLWKQEASPKFVKNQYHRTILKDAFQVQEVIFERILENNEFKQIVGENVDLLLLEAWVPSVRALAHIFKAPVITLSSFGAITNELNLIGTAMHPILYPICIHQRIQSHSLMDQLSDLYLTYFLHNMLEDVKKDEWILKSEFFRDVSSVSVLRNNVDMTILNFHPIWDQNRPVPLSLVYGGALHLKTVQELPEVREFHFFLLHTKRFKVGIYLSIL